MPITGKTRVVGVWGSPVTHSLSPIMQNFALEKLGLDWAYVPFSVEPGNISSAVQAIRALDLVGVNVTVPLKEHISPHLDFIDPVASKINSVNTIVNVGGRLSGYSTDGPGLLWDLADKRALPEAGAKTLILGAGGSARSVVYSFAQAGFAVSIANRTSERATRLVQDLEVDAEIVAWTRDSISDACRESSLIVNTTTIGMRKQDSEDLDVFLPGSIGSGQTLYDLVYAPPLTGMMRIATDGGAEAYNGLGMLVRQGALSLKLWSGISVEELPVSEMEKVIESYLR